VTHNQSQLGSFSFSSLFILPNFDLISNLLYHMKGIKKRHREILCFALTREYERRQSVVVSDRGKEGVGTQPDVMRFFFVNDLHTRRHEPKFTCTWQVSFLFIFSICSIRLL